MILHGRDAILRVRVKWVIFNMILQLWADVKYHVPTGFGFAPKTSGFCPFVDAADLDRCEALASAKGCFLCFCFSPQDFSNEVITLKRGWGGVK